MFLARIFNNLWKNAKKLKNKKNWRVFLFVLNAKPPDFSWSVNTVAWLRPGGL